MANPAKRNPPDPSLHCNEVHMDEIFSPEYWVKLCPWLTVSKRTNDNPQVSSLDGENQEKKSLTYSQDQKDELHSQFVQNGFFHIPPPDNDPEWYEKVDALAEAVRALRDHGWAPTFLYVYDQAWQIVEEMSKLLHEITGGSKFLGDLYAWQVDPKLGQTGWGPHRDRMGSNRASFRTNDNTPMLSTSWLALTDANPSNSCLYVVPAGFDPAYWVGDQPGEDILTSIFSNADNFQHIRALPTKRGGLWHFGHRVIHWGSAARTASPPRIAMSWIVGDRKFEEPAFEPSEHLPYPSIGLRVSFVAAQLISYGGQTNLKSGFRKFLFRMYQRNKSLLHPAYQQKVEYLFYVRPPPKRNEEEMLVKKRSSLPQGPVVKASESDDEKLGGMKGMFGDSSSSESEDGED